MADWIENRSGTRSDIHKRFAAGNLKRCPVCAAVNALRNSECFVCRWHGAFDHDPDSVAEALDLLLEECPELIDVMVTPIPERRTILSRMADRVRAMFCRRVDFQA